MEQIFTCVFFVKKSISPFRLNKTHVCKKTGRAYSGFVPSRALPSEHGKHEIHRNTLISSGLMQKDSCKKTCLKSSQKRGRPIGAGTMWLSQFGGYGPWEEHSRSPMANKLEALVVVRPGIFSLSISVADPFDFAASECILNSETKNMSTFGKSDAPTLGYLN